jgi:glutamyl-tRNA synthetase
MSRIDIRMSKIVTRFPPSPTGNLQAGNVRTAIFNYLFARQSGGKFILRIEDTDRERSKKEYEDGIIETLRWLGLGYDEFYRQSDHSSRHAEALERLIDSGKAYVSEETPTEAGQPVLPAGRRAQVIRFRNPNEKVTFTDSIRGEITIDTTDLGDFIIGKSITEPLYHFGVVVDDYDEGVTHVIRGDDHISNTPRQILILRALGGALPVYAHLPLLLGADRKKLSKRRGAKAVLEYRTEGFIPEAVINYLTLLGWHPEDEQEIFTLGELIERFDLMRIQKGAAIFDEVKMRWFNREHLRLLPLDEYINRLTIFMGGRGDSTPEYLSQIAGLLVERAETLGDAADLIKNSEFTFMGESISVSSDLLLKGAKADTTEVHEHLKHIHTLLEEVRADNWNEEQIKAAVFPYAEEKGKAQVLWPLRTALSGREKSPDPFIVAALIGRDRTLRRLTSAIELLTSN